MEYLKIEGEFPKLANCAVTMGKFDGFHRGHRKLVEKIRERKTLGEQAVLFAIDASSNMILTSQERASLLEKLGVDVLVECQLNDRIRHMKAENFIKEILMGDLGASYVVVGEDNRFGFERKGTPRLLMEFGEKYGFDVEILSKEMDGHRKISSTYIREELKKEIWRKSLPLWEGIILWKARWYMAGEWDIRFCFPLPISCLPGPRSCRQTVCM